MERRTVMVTREANGCRYFSRDGYQAAVIPMEPFGKARARVTVHGAYMPKRYSEARATLRMMFGTVTVRPPWCVRVTAVRRMPKSWSIRQRAEMNGAWCETKPDIDNVIGAALDSLFDEDAAVVSVSGVKVWGESHAFKVEVWTAGKSVGEAAVSPQELGLE